MKHIIIVPVSIVAACESAAWELGIQAHGKRVLCVDLVPDDSDDDAETTHVAGQGKLGLTDKETESRRAALEGGFNGGSFPGAMWWRMDDQGVLLASHLREAETHAGESWDFQSAISFTGLRRPQNNPF